MRNFKGTLKINNDKEEKNNYNLENILVTF